MVTERHGDKVSQNLPDESIEIEGFVFVGSIIVFATIVVPLAIFLVSGWRAGVMVASAVWLLVLSYESHLIPQFKHEVMRRVE